MTPEHSADDDRPWLKVVEELILELRLHCKDPIHDQQLLDVRAYRLLIDG